MGNVEIKDCIYIDGVATQIISGAMHYFRIVPDYWRDRLEKLKALGCNAVETYIPWNMHEPSKGIFCFNGMLDIRKFVQEAQNLDLYVILRPSPYTCGEWEFGGLPAWLLKEDSIYLRSCDPVFLRHVEEYYQTLMSQIVPLQYPFGGPVILMQIENEYGYYGSDQDYLNHLKAMYRKMGVIVPLVTSDGPERENMICGSVSEVQPTVNYGTNTNEKYEIAKSLIGDQLENHRFALLQKKMRL